MKDRAQDEGEGRDERRKIESMGGKKVVWKSRYLRVPAATIATRYSVHSGGLRLNPLEDKFFARIFHRFVLFQEHTNGDSNS